MLEALKGVYVLECFELWDIRPQHGDGDAEHLSHYVIPD